MQTKYFETLFFTAVFSFSLLFSSHVNAATPIKKLAKTLSIIVANEPGEVGVGLIVNGRDTVAVNDFPGYPMMSVFKVHQALALCHDFDRRGLSLDTLLTIRRSSLDAKTWSPMMKEHTEAEFRLTVKDLLRYTLTQSDNNASNLMFRRLTSVARTDSFIATIIPRHSFRIAYTEEAMAADHDKAYENFTSPTGAAALMNRLYTDSLVSKEKQDFIKQTLMECQTGKDRIVAPLMGKEDIAVGHKTGSGYKSADGRLAAHNDVAFIRLPNGNHYALAVFVKDYKGDETQAAKVIARVSEAVYKWMEEMP